MEITTKEITTKLRDAFVDGFLPVARDLRRDGFTDWEIWRSFEKYIECKSRQFYAKNKEFMSIGEIGKGILEEYRAKADSTIEMIYYKILQKEGIKFEFQYKISVFRADFLINGWLVFEIDGPDHDKGRDGIRDAHLKQLGYQTFRVPAWLASASPSAVIESIKELIN